MGSQSVPVTLGRELTGSSTQKPIPACGKDLGKASWKDFIRSESQHQIQAELPEGMWTSLDLVRVPAEDGPVEVDLLGALARALQVPTAE